MAISPHACNRPNIINDSVPFNVVEYNLTEKQQLRSHVRLALKPVTSLPFSTFVSISFSNSEDSCRVFVFRFFLVRHYLIASIMFTWADKS